MNDPQMSKSQFSTEEFLVLKKRLSAGKPLGLRVASDSMSPLLQVEQNIQVSLAPLETLKTFDLIVYLEQGKLQVHFLWHINNDGALITRSLKNPKTNDPLVPKSHYLGKVDKIGMSGWQKARVYLLNLLNGTM